MHEGYKFAGPYPYPIKRPLPPKARWGEASISNVMHTGEMEEPLMMNT